MTLRHICTNGTYLAERDMQSLLLSYSLQLFTSVNICRGQ